MEIVLYIIGSILLAILCFVVFLFFIIGLKLLVWFQFRTCKHCGKTMLYQGLRENDSESHYLFHCEHCGAWEQVTKEELFREVWDMDSVGDIATVTVHIKKIREKIEFDTAKPQYIETIWGVGYRFKV